MGADPTLFNDNMAAYLKNLEDRIRTLETSNRLLSSTIYGGQMQILRPDGLPVIYMGDLGPSGTGIVVFGPDGTSVIQLVTSVWGWGSPWLQSPWQRTDEYVVVTAGTMAAIWSSQTELLWSPEVVFRVVLAADAGTVGEAQVRIGGNVIGSVKTIPAGTGAYYEYRIAHGYTLGGGPIAVDLEARRVSGVGNLYIYHPQPLNWGGNMHDLPGGWS